jgi:hypothetical protein
VARAVGMWRSIRRPSGASPTSARTLGSRQCAGLCSATIVKSSKSASTLPLRGDEPAVASRLPLPARNLARPPHHLARLQSLGVDVTPDMGPFEIAPATQRDDGRAWKHEMFPSEDVWSRFAERGELVQPAGFGARSSNLRDAGSRRTFSGGRNFARGGRPARPAQAVIPAHRRKAHGAQTNCNVGVQRLARCLARSCANGEKPPSPKAGASKPTKRRRALC